MNRSDAQSPVPSLFPTDLPGLEYQEFRAESFSNSACGVIYRKKSHPAQGIPLGGLDTGRLGLETNATFGFCVEIPATVCSGAIMSII
jgi:hypothetical protein